MLTRRRKIVVAQIVVTTIDDNRKADDNFPIEITRLLRDCRLLTCCAKRGVDN